MQPVLRLAVDLEWKLSDNLFRGATVGSHSRCEGDHWMHHQPEEAASDDPVVLRTALIREAEERHRAECSAKMQTEVVQLALDLLVREPDIQGFFGVFAKTLVEETESHGCGVWLIDDDQQRCDLWMAYMSERLYTPTSAGWNTLALPRESMADHLFGYTQGWNQSVVYAGDDSRLPEPVRDFNRGEGVQVLVIAPLVLGARTLGWLALSTYQIPGCDGQWRVELLEAIARQAALALHQSRLAELNRLEERRKAILEERNRLARDIHDNLAQGFAAILDAASGRPA